jgi:hypothetical protein
MPALDGAMPLRAADIGLRIEFRNRAPILLAQAMAIGIQIDRMVGKAISKKFHRVALREPGFDPRVTPDYGTRIAFAFPVRAQNQTACDSRKNVSSNNGTRNRRNR